MNLKLGSFVLAATVALSVNGCWQKTEQTVEVEAEMVPVLDVYAGKNEEKNLKLLVQAYEKENQDVSIELHWIPDSEYSQQMMRIKNGESEADCIFFPEAGEAAIWKNKKILKNLSPWYETKNQVNASLYGDVEKDGALYMIPYRVGKICVYYNKTLFDSRGVEYPQENWTWEDYREKAGILTGWGNNKKVYGALGFENSSSWWMLPARTRGAFDPFKEEDLKMFRESAEWCHAFISESAEKTPYMSRTDDDWSGYHILFAEGRLGMYFGEDGEVNTINQELRKTGMNIEYDVMELPSWEGTEKADVYNTAVVAMAEATKYPEETYRFMKFCTGEEGGKILAKNRTVPFLQSPEVLKIYLSGTQIPEHAEYFLMDQAPRGLAVGTLYNGGIEVMRREVSMYLLGEQELEYTFKTIEEELAKLRVR